MRLTVYSDKNAERSKSPYDSRNHGKPKAYVAVLKKGLRDTVDREFVKRERVSANKFRFCITFEPGDIFEVRRWRWDDLREAYTGGTVYMGVNQDGTPQLLTRDEAFLNILSDKLDKPQGSNPETAPARLLPQRMLPGDLIFE